MSETSPSIIGWDIGGAHVKACLLRNGRITDIAEWLCPLWKGTSYLEESLQAALIRWPELASARHAVTMTGEMVDHFPDRQEGVEAITRVIAAILGEETLIFAGARSWVTPATAAEYWRHLASANWRATAQWLAQSLPQAVLVDIGSTTTDLIPVRDGKIALNIHDDAGDAARLAMGALVYQGVVRTPLCALAQHVPFRDAAFNVMNEWFATSSDVYRLTGELDERHDLHPAADNGPKSLTGSRQRLARMIGHDMQDATPEDWDAFAAMWRSRQMDLIAGELAKILRDTHMPPNTPLVAAGCGAFLGKALGERFNLPVIGIEELMTGEPEKSATPQADEPCWAAVCAPAVAVALLAHSAEKRVTCGSSRSEAA
ncbi:hydantoinase/oxoprolinase family protein [Xanthobacter sp. TB0139]|uniref:hydantoinase/oxoprolinase family protein n=1 Tax=Xanthobacter sp. TB0139 TaxID=3459178 RepID=UPI004039E599